MTSDDASLTRLSPSSTVTIRRGSLNERSTDVAATGERTARAAGVACGRAKTSDVVDAGNELTGGVTDDGLAAALDTLPR